MVSLIELNPSRYVLEFLDTTLDAYQPPKLKTLYFDFIMLYENFKMTDEPLIFTQCLIFFWQNYLFLCIP